MTRHSLFFYYLLLLLLLTACQPASAGQTTPARAIEYVLVEGEPLPDQSQAILTAAGPPEQPAAPTAIPQVEPPVQAVLDYAALLQAGDYRQAAELTSTFSLSAVELTRSEVEQELQARMKNETWTGFDVAGSRALDERTHLVGVAYRVRRENPAEDQAEDEQVRLLWAVRKENGAWRINHDGLVDFRLLDVHEQTTAGLTVKPRSLARYTDHMELSLLVQNQTHEPIVLGQANEILATFFFGDQPVQAEHTQLIFDRLRSYPETTLTVLGFFEQFPDGVEIRRWKNYNVEPWYSFSFGE